MANFMPDPVRSGDQARSGEYMDRKKTLCIYCVLLCISVIVAVVCLYVGWMEACIYLSLHVSDKKTEV